MPSELRPAGALPRTVVNTDVFDQSNRSLAAASHEQAQHLARAICLGFMRHDEGRYEDACTHFAEVCAALYRDVAVEDTRDAATCFVAALQIKDAIDLEDDRRVRFADPRWSKVYDAFVSYCGFLRMPVLYAYHSTEFWRAHKGECDYWSHCLAAERIASEHLLGATEWTRKSSDGRNGHGVLATLYLVGVEAHDLHSAAAWDLAERVMTLYFEIVLQAFLETRP